MSVQSKDSHNPDTGEPAHSKSEINKRVRMTKQQTEMVIIDKRGNRLTVHVSERSQE